MHSLIVSILTFSFFFSLMLGQDAGQRLKDQGTFYVGDLPFTMFVQYRVPENFNGLSMVFMHGAGQNGSMYETTPDGRPGWIFFFLQRGFAVYNVDWPCMGRSAFVSECPSISGRDVINAGVQLLDRIQTPTILLSWSTSGTFVTGMTDQRPQKVRGMILVEGAEVGNMMDQPLDAPGFHRQNKFTVRPGRPRPEDLTAFKNFRRINEDVGTDGIPGTDDPDGSEENGILDAGEDANGNGLLDFPSSFYTHEPMFPPPPANAQLAKGATPTMPGITNERRNHPKLELCDKDRNGVISDMELLGPNGGGSYACCDTDKDGTVTREEILACGSQIEIEEPVTFRDTTKVLSVVTGIIPPDPDGTTLDKVSDVDLRAFHRVESEAPLTSREIEAARTYYAEFPFPQYSLSFMPFDREENVHKYFRRQGVDATLFYLRDTIEFPFPRRNPPSNPDSIENVAEGIYSTSLGIRIGNGHAMPWAKNSDVIAGLIYDWIEAKVIEDKPFEPGPKNKTTSEQDE